MKNKLTSKDLESIGILKNESKGMAIMMAAKYFKHTEKEEILQQFKRVKEAPELFLKDQTVAKLAYTFIEIIEEKTFKTFALNEVIAPYQVYGKQHIEEIAQKQMDIALRLPISVKGALMPDAHSGYGLPIGGVLACDNAVIPYGVGVDIGCRMALTIYDLSEKQLAQKTYEFKTALKAHTHFGMDGMLDVPQDHEVLENTNFQSTALLRRLHGKAIRQLGTSGGGNHFVEFGLVELNENNTLGIPSGTYVGLLSHSGSRGFGATIAQHYTNIAMDKCKLPKEAKHLAWLDMNSAEGQEYWLSMNLAGEYAKACHDRIHFNLAKAMGIKPIAKIENHHNFAWKEIVGSKEVIVHRKGATPAHKGELGIIPGSMTSAGYIVSGLGIEAAINSASHGAGRQMSRSKAKNSITVSDFKKITKNAGITLLGATPEEAPMAYKNIEEIMVAQQNLVAIEGKFIPKIVRMNKE
jgi:tRNA-splicing ligase RtcB (3'-phosphate/5'-hydroxy nucleic acid ligase)